MVQRLPYGLILVVLLASSAVRATDITALVLDPRAPNTLYLGTSYSGLFKSTNGAASWSPTGLTGTPVSALAIDPRNSKLYALTRAGVLRSADGARSWTATFLMSENFSGFIYGFPNPAVGTFGSLGIAPTTNPSAPATVHAGLTFVTADAFTEYVWGEVLRSADDDASWAPIVPFFGDPWAFPAWRSAPALAVAPQTSAIPATVYTAGYAEYDVCWVRDEGATIGCAVLGQAFVGATALAVDPQNPVKVYVGTNGSGVYKTSNGGASWTGGGVGTVTSLAVDPRLPSVIYAGTSDLGVLKSTDGGASWTAVNAGLSSAGIRVVAVDPYVSATVYAATAIAVFRSNDGGRNWSLAGSP
jgi:hypothetical protein